MEKANRKFRMTAACVAGCLVLATATLAQGTKSAAPPNGEAVVSSVSVTATVTKIDQEAREITLKAEDGEYSFVADPAVQSFSQVKKGDLVTVTYTEALAKTASEILKVGGDP
jgi:hypothetical protein